MENDRFLCIDLKSFFASVECVERGLDPMSTNLVVADPDRTESTICLAVSPSMKALGVRNRCRVYEIPSWIPYIMATPRMQKYLDYSAEINRIYRTFLAPEDVQTYSIDESFLDVTKYLKYYKMTARELGVTIMNEITRRLGLRSTCGIGTNLYLTKIALDITAKHAPDFIGELDEAAYRETLWDHRPLTDFWMIGEATARTLGRHGIFTMGGIAAAPRDCLHRWFGVNADTLIDHAWGKEQVTMKDVKSYRPKSKSLSSGQVLPRDYSFAECRVIIREMTDALCLDLTAHGLVTEAVTLELCYASHTGLPPVRGSVCPPHPTDSDLLLLPAVTSLYESIVSRASPLRRVSICFTRVRAADCRQISFFDDPADDDEHRSLRLALLGIRSRYGKNAVFRGMDLLEGATARERNRQIGGHKTGVG